MALRRSAQKLLTSARQDLSSVVSTQNTAVVKKSGAIVLLQQLSDHLAILTLKITPNYNLHAAGRGLQGLRCSGEVQRLRWRVEALSHPMAAAAAHHTHLSQPQPVRNDEDYEKFAADSSRSHVTVRSDRG